MKYLPVFSIFVFFAFQMGCASASKQLDESADFYFDNNVRFEPNRIWRVEVGSEPYLLDSEKNLVQKRFQLIVEKKEERARLENDIRNRGGDALYLKWVVSELAPIGVWEKPDANSIARHKDQTIVTVTTRSIKQEDASGLLRISDLRFPDRLLRAVSDGCHELNWDVISKDESLGLEVTLKSRKEKPSAVGWKKTEKNLANFRWQRWSVGQGRQISYRTLIHFKNNVSRCPLPPQVHTEFNAILSNQKMGIEW